MEFQTSHACEKNIFPVSLLLTFETSLIIFRIFTVKKSGNTPPEIVVVMAVIFFLLGRDWDFTKQNDSEPSSYVTPYDYSSIMHYGDGFASKNDEKTLVPKKSGVSREIKHNQISKIKAMFTLDLNMLRLILLVLPYEK